MKKRVDEKKRLFQTSDQRLVTGKHHKNINKLGKIHQKGQSNTDMESGTADVDGNAVEVEASDRQSQTSLKSVIEK